MIKNEVKQLKTSLSSNTGSNYLNENNTKIVSSQKESQTAQNKNITPKNKSISTNQIFVPIEEDKKSKPSNSKNSKKKKEKSESYKNKKKNEERIVKLLSKNERIKIPKCKKRRSFAFTGDNLTLNLNNINNNLLKSLTPPKQINIRTDKNGIEINKTNKKLVHITFLDDISPNNKITETVVIQSFKKFNIVEDNSGDKNLSNCSKCCNIY